MSLPKGGVSLEWMSATTKSMNKLQEKMEKLFPKEMAALLAKHPDVESITWEQYSESGFTMTPLKINLKATAKKFNEKALRKEVEQLVSPMPSSSLLKMYSHYTNVTCHSVGVSSKYNSKEFYYNEIQSGIGRATPGKVELTASPLGECFKEYYELREQASEAVKKLLLAHITKHKDVIKSIQWRQYTPGFMDGDTCSFYARSVGVLFMDGEGYVTEDDGPIDDQRPYINDTQKLIDAIHEDVLYTLYGDHAEITVTPKKVTAAEYLDHD